MSEKMTALANAVSAHDELVSRLAEHRKLEQEVSDYEAACSKAEADEADALKIIRSVKMKLLNESLRHRFEKMFMHPGLRRSAKR
jgi:hypothetical protein